MAKRVVLIDDLDDSEGAETIRYAVDGQEYEIDLSEKNAERFRTMLKEFIDASREAERPSAALQPTRSGRRQSIGTLNAKACEALRGYLRLSVARLDAR
ncbi:MAG: hypothetical protein JWP40_4288 [Blastococcus sp.]|nr:hypothetical protein [Blastococcus sp.]